MTALVARRADELDGALLDMLQAFVARAPLFAGLRARGEAEDLVQEALITVRRRLADGDVDDPFAYATRVVQNLARRAYARARPETATDAAGLEAVGPVGDVADVAERRSELEEVLGMVRAVRMVVCELPAADVELIRAELRRDDQRALAQRLGMSRATFYRRKHDALCGFVTAVARGASAEPCPDRVEALLAAAGGSGFASARRAREHAQSCLHCEATLRHLTAARHGLAIVAPLPSLVVVDSVTSAERLSFTLQGGWDWLRGIAVRGPDPAAFLPASRGTAAALAVACVGFGGTTYCAVDGVPRPVRDALGMAEERSRSDQPAPAVARRPAPVRAMSPASPGAQGLASRASPQPSAGRASPRPEFRGRRPKPGVAEAEFRRAGSTRTARSAEFRAPERRGAVAGSTSTSPRRSAPAGAAEQEFGGDALGREFR